MCCEANDFCKSALVTIKESSIISTNHLLVYPVPTKFKVASHAPSNVKENNH